MALAESRPGISDAHRGAPVVRVVAADAARAARLAGRLSELGAEARVAGGAGLTAAAHGAPVDAVLVVVEGFEAVASGLPGHHVQLVAVEPRTPPVLRGRPVLPVHADGVLEAWCVLLGERVRAAQRAAELEGCLHALFEGDDAGLVIVDETQRILIANPTASELVGTPLQTGERLPFDLPSGAARGVMTIGRHPVAVGASALEWQGQRALLVRLRTAAGPESFEGRLAHADRLVAVGALAAGFAHEVNNPAQTLTADLSELTEQLRILDRDLVRARALVPPDQTERFDRLGLSGSLGRSQALVQECFDGLGRIAGIVRDLKSFSRIQPDRVDWVHPNEIVNQACAIAHNHIRHRARLVKDLGALETFPGDRNKLVQVVTNLLVNAAQAIPEEAQPGQVVVRTRVEQGRVVITVLDSGQGIPAEVLERMFEPFYTTKAGGGGTGLGLAMSLDIARQHGGTLDVETTVGEGSRFHLVLPLENGLRVECTERPRKTHDILQRGRVLVVDDEPGILRSLGRLIGRNHEVTTCSDGEEAVALLVEDGSFDVVLCDLMMPELDGPAVYDAVAEKAPHLAARMVFMSGGAFTERSQRFLERVKPVVLDKPAPASLLEEAIQHVLARSELTTELPGERPGGPPTRSLT